MIPQDVREFLFDCLGWRERRAADLGDMGRERESDDMYAAIAAARQWLDSLPQMPQPDDARNTIIRDFYRQVCERAERNMELTGTVSGAHWNAMRAILKEMGIQE